MRSIATSTGSSDLNSQSTPVHALSFLLGIKLMPRIRNWKDLTFFRPSKDAKYRHIDGLFRSEQPVDPGPCPFVSARDQTDAAHPQLEGPDILPPEQGCEVSPHRRAVPI